MPKAKQKKETPPPISEIETFRDVRGWTLANLIQPEPDCFNSIVSVHRYRVRVELIEEPNEVIAERIRKLWRECDNFHHWKPLEGAAAKIGIELDRDECGKDRK
jgi:hypothetical protein